MSIEDKLTTIAENVPKVYEAGQKSMVDESKIIEATATAENILALDDVSEIPHDVTITVKSKNLIASPFGTFDVENGKTYTFSFKLKEGVTLPEDAQYMLCYYDQYGYWNNQNLIQDGVVLSTEYSFTAGHNGNHDYHIDYINMTEDMFEYVQLEELVDLSSATVRVSGKNLLDIDNMLNEFLTKNGDEYTLTRTENKRFSKYLNTYIPAGTPLIFRTGGITSYGVDNIAVGLQLIFEDGTSNTNLSLGKSNTPRRGTFDKNVIRMALYVNNVEAIGTPISTFTKPMLEVGTTATEYEPFVELITLSLDDEGKATTKSMSPNMIFTSSVSGVLITADYHKSYGMHMEWNKVWDAIQNYGKRTSFPYAFAYSSWNDKNFKPKYDIRPIGNASTLFRDAEIVDLEATLQKCGVVLDTSQVTSLNYAFYCPYLQVIPTIDMTKITTINETNLALRSPIITIRKIIMAETTPFYSQCFRNATNLENLIFEGVIGCNGIDLQWSPKLSHDSIVSIINALSTTTSGLTVTLSKTAVNNAFETSAGAVDGSTSQEWLNLIATRNNWTISLV